ncbi:MAG: hypothetical protein ACI3VN_00420 [Candidatus Onthomonas sp.]
MVWKKVYTALRIEWLWIKIHWHRRKLRKQQKQTSVARVERIIAVYRYEAEQLSCLYEVLVGLRAPDGNLC